MGGGRQLNQFIDNIKAGTSVAGDRQGELRHLMGKIFREQARQPHLVLGVLREHWPAIVGADLADKTHPRRIAKGVLWINAVDSSWAYQLQFMKTELLQSVRAFLESEQVSDLRFQQGEVPASAPVPVPKPRKQPMPEKSAKHQEPVPALAPAPASAPAPALAPVPVPKPRKQPMPEKSAKHQEPVPAREESGIDSPGLRDSFSRWRNARQRQQGRKDNDPG